MLSKLPRAPVASHSREQPAFPTVLVAVRNEALRQKLVDELAQDQCLVLEAETENKAVTIIITHSRPIHVLLVAVSLESQELEQRFRKYRPNLHVVCVTADPRRLREGVDLPYLALSKVRELLGTNAGTGRPYRAATASGAG